MGWYYTLYSKVEEDKKSLSKSDKIRIIRKLDEVVKNPLPFTEGGFGEPLGHKYGNNLTGCCKIKHRGIGKRTVYKLYRTDEEMYIIVISGRADFEVYDIAANRLPDAEAERVLRD
ncbi:MAG: type II toxin-antitoxin system RelE/ParE family toxin [Ruminococcus sp.]|jgi:mRNA interferase RelE/StbE|nr:type II toxin-antitoxin system RelE/ParE family toxin [Ruminococcus sp.]